MFRIYQIRDYEVYWDMGPAVVSAKSPEDACDLLKDYLRSDEETKHWAGKEDIGFRVRGEIIDTGIDANARAVIFARNKRTFSQTKASDE
jgi:hypothetical protein